MSASAEVSPSLAGPPPRIRCRACLSSSLRWLALRAAVLIPLALLLHNGAAVLQRAAAPREFSGVPALQLSSSPEDAPVPAFPGLRVFDAQPPAPPAPPPLPAPPPPSIPGLIAVPATAPSSSCSPSPPPSPPPPPAPSPLPPTLAAFSAFLPGAGGEFTSTEQASQPVSEADWRAWSATGAAAFSPAAAAAPARALVPGGRYLVPLMIVEGFGAWSDAIHETLWLAAALNRSWVEPCVRNGCIEPCRCGAIRPAARWSAASAAGAAAAGADPGALPRVDVDCKIDLGRRETPPTLVAEAYPLSAYIDMRALLAGYAGVAVSYAEFCAAYEAEHAPAREHVFGRWVAPRAYSFGQLIDVDEAAGSAAVGDFFFQGLRWGRAAPPVPGSPHRDESREAVWALLSGDGAAALFLYQYYRGQFSLIGAHGALPIARWHTAAVERYVRGALRGPPYAAFHWRSEQADPRLFLNCSAELAAIAAAALPAHARAEAPRVALVADMPAPGNNARAWNDYKDAGMHLQQEAMGYMISHGFSKYDAHLNISSAAGNALDAGVLSLRDFLIAAGADMYVTCQGDHWQTCRGCFRAGSNIVARIKKERADRGHDANTTSFFWYDLTTEQLPPALRAAQAAEAPPPPPPALRGGAA